MDLKTINYKAAIKNNSQRELKKIKTCLEQDFETTLDWLISRKINNKPFTQFQVFWNSDFPLLFTEAFFQSEHGKTLLQHYFKQYYFHRKTKKVKSCSPIPTNITLLQKISEIIPSTLMEVIKIGKYFLNNKHFESFQFFQYCPNEKLKEFYIICQVFRKINLKQERLKQKYDKLLQKTAIEDLLIHYSLYIEKIKWKYKYQDYSIYGKEITFLPQIMSLIIQRKLTKNIKVVPKYLTTDDFDEALMKILATKIKTPKPYKVFEELFATYHNIWTWETNYLDSFCYDKNYTAFIRRDNCIELRPKDIDQHHNWLKTGKKYQYMIDYYGLKSLNYLDMIEEATKKKIEYPGKTENHRQMNQDAQQKAFSQAFMIESYSLLNKIELTPNKPINPYWLIHYLEVFSANSRYRFSNEVEAYYHKSKKNYLECISHTFLKQAIKLGINASPVRVDTFDAFKKIMLDMQSGGGNLLNYKFEATATEKEIINALDFYLLDFNNLRSIFQIDLQIHPIIKIGNLCYSVPSLIGNTNTASVLINKLLPNTKRKKERNQETEQMAINLAKLFKERGFKTIAELKLKDKNKQDITDIDCAAYKDGVLFLIELKSTYLRANLKELLHNEIALNKAGKQLEKVEQYLKHNFEIIQKKLEIKKPIEEIKLYPLIVSTSFEQDYESFNGYRKISLFELNIILNNEKNYLLLTGTHQKKIVEKCFPNFDANELTQTKNNVNEELEQKLITAIKKINPYENSFYPIDDECSPTYIIEAIEKDKVWNFLDDEPYPKFSYVQSIIPIDDNASKRYSEHNTIFRQALAAQYKEENTKKSMKLVEQALALNPNDDEYLVLRGDNYARLGYPWKSILDLKKAVEINPQNETAHSNLAISYFESGNLKDALYHINKAVSLNRSNQYSLLTRSKIKINLGLINSAKHDLKRVTAINPNNDFGKEANFIYRRF